MNTPARIRYYLRHPAALLHRNCYNADIGMFIDDTVTLSAHPVDTVGAFVTGEPYGEPVSGITIAFDDGWDAQIGGGARALRAMAQILADQADRCEAAARHEGDAP